MKNIFKYGLIFSLILSSVIGLKGQGPPITADKPIMLGSESIIIKTLTEFRSTEDASFIRAPFMFHYLPTSNSLVAIHVPWVSASYEFADGDDRSGLGDIDILAKYQFFRKDGKGKTFRMVVKSLNRLPTGIDVGVDEISVDHYQSYLAIVAGRESIKYGLSWEAGYNIVPSKNTDEWRARFGVGLPLLKPLYPVKQINLYFEYAYNVRPGINERELLYAQGVQYAKGRLTMEAAIQVPLYQKVNGSRLKHNFLLGTRYIF